MSDTKSDGAPKPQPTFGEILQKSAKRALGGGFAGALAMGLNVGTLMWMRTTINYQYRYGTTTTEAFKTLYKQGGIPRFYRGVGPALIQGPLSRFGDTAANTGVLMFLDSFDSTKDLSNPVKTLCSSTCAAGWRIFLMPVDTLKTTMQVEGKDGVTKLRAKFRTNGFGTFYQGALATFTATWVGHYPWFVTYNTLSDALPTWDLGNELVNKLSRKAAIGFFASMVSDCCSNSIRVVKVYKQSNTELISYPECVKRVIAEDGLTGLFGRGLKTKIMANGMQGLMFSVLWNIIDDQLFPKK